MSYFKIIENETVVGVSELKIIHENQKCVEIDKSEYDKILEKFNKDDELQKKIFELRTKLTQTDYKAIKYAEGLISETDYAEIKAQRQAWRDEINKLENY